MSGSRPPRREYPTLWSRAALLCLFDPGARRAKPGRLTPLSPSSDAIAGLFDRWLCSEPAARSCLGTSCARLPVGDRCCVVPCNGEAQPRRCGDGRAYSAPTTSKYASGDDLERARPLLQDRDLGNRIKTFSRGDEGKGISP